jgi:hypothetical protein
MQQNKLITIFEKDRIHNKNLFYSIFFISLKQKNNYSYVGVQFKTRIDLNNIKILNILFLIFNF